MGKVIGIDLGTTNSVVAILENGKARVVQNDLFKESTPSVVALKTVKDKASGKTDKMWIIGEHAKNQIGNNAINTLHGTKRLMGRQFKDEEVQKMMQHSAFKIVAAPNGDAHVEVAGQRMSPVEVATKVLMEMKDIAQKYAGEEITDAVVTVPAYFNDAQREATRQAGLAAGLNVLRIINEPTAAALAFGMDQEKDGVFAVYSWGGGTFDVSILEITNDPVHGKLFEVRASKGDTFLGGENLDEAVADHLLKEFNEQNNNALDISTPAARLQNADALQKFKEAAEKAKIQLSSSEAVTINIPFVMIVDGAPLAFETQLSRNGFVDIIRPFIEKTRGPFEDALKEAGVDKKDLKAVLLMGGSSRIPAVQAFVEEISGQKPNSKAHPKNSVAEGACIQAAIMTKQPGFEDGKVILADVTALSLGIRSTLGTNKDVMTVIIPRNSTIPTEKTINDFKTAKDDQDNVEIVIYQGERPLASDNRKIGEFIVNLPPGVPAGTNVSITMALDANGELNVTAKVAGRENKVTVNPATGLSDAELQAILKRAAESKAADEALMARIATESTADEMLKKAKKDITEDWYTGAPDGLKTTFNDAVTALGDARKAGAVQADLETKMQSVKEARTALGQAFMAANAPAAAPSEEPQVTTPEPGTEQSKLKISYNP